MKDQNSKTEGYRIGEAAEMMGVCPNTLRNWDKKGFLVAMRNYRNHRLYSLGEIIRIRELMGYRKRPVNK
jgi:DNA-binding transcriptional MerR regulator